MNGIHDIGGMEGLGEIRQVENEPRFYEDWERTAFAILLGMAAQGYWNLDEFRHGFERMNPVHHFTAGYYAKWLSSSSTLLVEKGVIDKDELDQRTEMYKKNPNKEIPTRKDPELVEQVKQLVKHGGSTEREVTFNPKFYVGQKVKTKNIHPSGHTRLPRYARDKYGVINEIYGAHVFPDASAHGKGDNPEYLYSVKFDGYELWGEEKRETVYLDLWDSYLMPVDN